MHFVMLLLLLIMMMDDDHDDDYDDDHDDIDGFVILKSKTKYIINTRYNKSIVYGCSAYIAC